MLLPPGPYDYNLYTHGIEFRRENGSFTVMSGEDLEPLLYGPGGISERYWKGRRLPFPLVFDGLGGSFDPFGTLGYFEMLIDPEGNLVRGGNTAMLARILAGEPIRPKRP